MFKIIQCLYYKKAINKPFIKRDGFRSICHPYLECKKHKDPKIFKNILFFMCVPIILLCLADIFIVNPEEGDRPEFIKYEYLRIRKKGYPWDPVRTLFHHPYYNALPDGYETPDRHENESK
ncbi:cytochrome C oxidase, putative [Pediculus humanus corporis]|uniref:Cytochrome C oxidase, putative n=1 Tax=Pediculus humanus subsp. corporis TaxID=121224 RepID=E0VQT8_PEDHC|nr:cytochrome C oxidase, putative [Pediculus humanus corporis]EEB15744.1 cytochrome C oxidase, putative [Pediculus humanus corporis]